MSHHHGPGPTEDRATTIMIRTPADIVAVLPYLVGYHEDNSLQLAIFEGNHIQAVLHRELPEQSEDLTAFVTDTIDMLMRNRVPRVALIGHGPGERVTRIMDALSPALKAQHISVVDMIRYENGRCWSYLCSNPACCPPNGIPYDTVASPAAAHAVAAGMVAMPDKESFEQILQPVQGQEREIMTAATAAARARTEAMLIDPNNDDRHWFGEGLRCARECFEHVRAGRPIPAESVAWLGILLTGTTVRDIALTLRREYGADVAQQLWSDVTRRIDPAYAAAPATNLAHTALLNGAGALARIAVNRALEAQPDYSFARLILAALQLGITSSAFNGETMLDDMITEITHHAAQHPLSAKPVLPAAPTEP